MAVRTLRKYVARLLGGVTHDHCNSLSRGGLKVGDIILAFNEVEIDEAARLRREIDRAGTGALVTAIVRRDIRTRIWELLVGCVCLFIIDNRLSQECGHGAVRRRCLIAKRRYGSEKAAGSVALFIKAALKSDD
jgi:hypothetical protein